MNIINDMLDKLDKHYLKTHNNSIFEEKAFKWFDPANGMGNFPVAIYLRLMEGLKNQIKNDHNRKKHILENMLYMSELNKKNVFVCKQIFDINNEFKLNIYNGDSLKLNINKEWDIKQFDVIIGNPPYNKELTKTGANPLYNEFIEKYIDKCKYLTFIVPSRWFVGGRGLDKFRKMMLNRSDIVYIMHFNNASSIFGNDVNIEGGVNYFLMDYQYNGLCQLNDSKIKLNKYDIIVDSKYYDIIDKLSKHENINKLYISQDHYKIQTNDKRLTDNKKSLKCYVSQQKGFIKYIDKKYIKKPTDTYKVITARANGKNGCFGNTFIGNKNEVHSKSYISFEIESKQEADSLLNYMNCRLPNFMLSLRKISQDISQNTCKWIPLPTLDKKWTDNDVYKYFKLSKAEIELIEKTDIKGFSKKSKN